MEQTATDNIDVVVFLTGSQPTSTMSIIGSTARTCQYLLPRISRRGKEYLWLTGMQRRQKGSRGTGIQGKKEDSRAASGVTDLRWDAMAKGKGSVAKF